MGGCLCFLCLVLCSLIIPPCFVIHLCIYSILPVDAKAYAYPALVNSHISSFFFWFNSPECALFLSLTYIPSGGFPTCSIPFLFIPSPLQAFLFQGANFAVGWSRLIWPLFLCQWWCGYSDYLYAYFSFVIRRPAGCRRQDVRLGGWIRLTWVVEFFFAGLGRGWVDVCAFAVFLHLRWLVDR